MRHVLPLLLASFLFTTAHAQETTRVTIENIGPVYPVLKSGAFTMPVGAGEAGPIGPGGAYEATFTAGSGTRLSFATMVVQSNDAFYAFAPEGLPLFVDGEPVTGGVTDCVMLWDAGTEVDEEPGVGLNQAPRQSGPDTGEDEGGVIVEIDGEDDGYPATTDVIRVTLIRDTQTDAEGLEEKPIRLGTLESYPNPLRDRATLRYGLDEPSHVTLAIYDVLGRQVVMLVDASQRAGDHRVVWDAQGCSLATGVYLLRLALDGQPAATRTLTLLR